MTNTIKAAANAMATPVTPATAIKKEEAKTMNNQKTALEIIEQMQVTIASSLTGNMFVRKEGQTEAEAKKEHRENFVETVQEAVKVVGDLSTARLEFSSTTGNSDIVEEPILEVPGMQFNAPHFMINALDNNGAQKKVNELLFSLVVTSENKAELTKEYDLLAKNIFEKTNGLQWEYEGARVVFKNEEMTISTKKFYKGIKKVEGEFVTEGRFKQGTVSEFIDVTVVYNDERTDKVFEIKAPYLKCVTFEELVVMIEKASIEGMSAHLKKCIKKIKKEHKSFLRNVEGESNLLTFALDDKGNVYNANVKKRLADGSWVLVDTKTNLEQIYNELILFVANTTTKDTDMTPLLFLKELNQPQAIEAFEGPDKERTNLYNKAIFNYSGKIEDLANSSREAITKLLSVSLVAEDYINNMLHDRAEAAIAFKNDSAPMGGTGSTAVEFNQGINSIWMDTVVWDLFWSSKITRALNTTNGCLNSRYDAMVLDDQLVPVFFVNKAKVGRWSVALDMMLANFQTMLALAPDYLFNKVSGAINKENAIGIKLSLDALKGMCVSEDISIELVEESAPEFVEIYNLIVEKFGAFIFVLRNGEKKAENAIHFFEHEARLGFLKTGNYIQPTDKQKENSVLENENSKLRTTKIKIRVGKKTEVVELAYGLMRAGVHYKKDCWNAVGKSAIGAKTATYQNYATTICNGSGTASENEMLFAKENLKDAKEMKQILAAGNMKLVKGSMELASKEDLKLYIPDNAEPSTLLNKVLAEYSDCRTSNELEANYIWGDRELSNNKGLILKEGRFYKFTEKEDGSLVRFITKDFSEFLMTLDEVTKLYEEHEYLTPEKMSVLRDILLKLIDGKMTLVDSNVEILRVLERTRAIAINKDLYLPFYPSSKKITTAAVPTELTQAIAVWSAVTMAGGDLQTVLDFEKELFIERLKTDSIFRARMKESFEIAKKGKNIFEIDGVQYKLKKDFVNRMNSTKQILFKPMLEMRKALLTKKAFDYILEEKTRFNLIALTHSGSAFVAYVNQKTFDSMIKHDVLAEKDGKRYGSNTRFPETYLSGLTLRFKVWNRVPDNCICVSDIVLAILMGDTDGDTIAVKKPYDLSLETEIHKEITRCVKPFRAFYNEMQKEVLDSPAAAYKKYKRVFETFKEDHRAAFAELRTGVLLNEGTDAKTGLVVAWETRMTLLLFSMGADKETIKRFKFIVGGFLSQITIASKNADKDALLSFEETWKAFAKGTTIAEEIEAIFNLVEYKFI